MTELTPEMRAELRAKAEAMVPDREWAMGHGPNGTVNRAFMKALTRDTVLALLDELDRAEAAVEKLLLVADDQAVCPQAFNCSDPDAICSECPHNISTVEGWREWAYQTPQEPTPCDALPPHADAAPAEPQ